MKIGYARVSTGTQNLQSQITALKEAGCEKIFQEKKSGKQSDNRQQLQEALDFCRKDDVFIVTRLDRCSRSTKDLHNILDLLKNKEVQFKATEQDIDTTTSAGRLMIGLLSIVSAFETDIRAERQADGIKEAKKNGVKFGREEIKIDIEEAISLKKGGMTSQAVADKYEVSRNTLLRKIREFKSELS